MEYRNEAARRRVLVSVFLRLFGQFKQRRYRIDLTLGAQFLLANLLQLTFDTPLFRFNFSKLVFERVALVLQCVTGNRQNVLLELDKDPSGFEVSPQLGRNDTISTAILGSVEALVGESNQPVAHFPSLALG